MRDRSAARGASAVGTLVGKQAKPVKTKRDRSFHTQALRNADEIQRVVNHYAENPRANAKRLRELGLTPHQIRTVHRTSVPNTAVAQMARSNTKAQGFFKLGGKFAEDLTTAAIYSPAGLYQAGKAVGGDIASTALGKPTVKRSARLGKQIGKGVAEDIRHPLRHPGYTALDVFGAASLAAGAGARAGAIGRAARAGSGRAALKAAVTKPRAGRITYKLGDLEVQKPASRNVLVRQAQKRRAGKAGPSKIGKELERQAHFEAEAARAPANLLLHRGRKLNPAQQMALRVVAEGKPISERIKFHREQAKGKSALERRDHAKQIRLLRGAERYVVDVQGKPRIRGDAGKVGKAYEQLKSVGAQRETILRDTGQMTAEGLEARKHAPGRVIEGTHGESARLAFGKRLGRSEREATISEYERRFGNIVNTDLARELSPEYAASRESRALLAYAIHEPSSKLAKIIYTRKLSRTPTGDKTVEFTAGGAGAGKSVFVNSSKSEIVYDTNLSRFPAAVDKIEKALRSGRKVRITYVDRNPIEALKNGALSRAEKEGRTLPIGEHVRTHVEANRVLRRLAERYRGDPRVEIRVIHNEPGGPREGTLASLPKLRHNEVAHEALNTLEAERAARRISERTYLGFSRGKETVARHHGARAGESQAGSEEVGFRGGEVYVPAFKSEPRGGIGGMARTGPVVGQVRKLVSRNKQFTGASLRKGQIPENTTGLVARQTTRAVRYLHSDRFRQQVLKAAHDERRSEHDVLINDRTLRNPKLPPEAKALVGKENYTLDELSGHTTAFEDFRRKLFPMTHNQDFSALGPEERLAAQAGGKVKGYKWVDERLLRGINRPAHFVSSKAGRGVLNVIDTINNASKMAILYLKPAYAVPNMGGNLFLNLVQQGFAAPGNLARSARLSTKIGDEAAATLDSIMGEGIAKSIATEQGVGQRAVNFAAGKWSGVVDLPFRRAAFIHEARVLGYRTREQLAALLTKDEHAADRLEAAQRASDAIIDYSRLPELGRDTVRRVIFFYPWVVGSTRYAGHFIAEHPAQAATQAQLARIGKEKAGLGPVPSYLEGSFRVGGKLVNPAAASIFGTSAQVVNTLRGVAEGHPKESARLSDFVTPAAALALANITRQSSLGIPFKPENNFTDIARKTLIDSLPQAALARRIKALAIHEDQSRKLFPVKSPSDAIAPFLIGGVAPRSYNPDVVAAQAKREQRESQTPEQRLSSDYKQFHAELRAAMAKVGEQQIPKKVRGRLALRYERARARASLGSRPTSLEAFKSDVTLIVRHGWMKPDEAAQAVAWAEKAHKRELSTALGYLSRHYFDPDSLLSKSLSYLRENGSPELDLPRLP